jgi:hypothetical protein
MRTADIRWPVIAFLVVLVAGLIVVAWLWASMQPGHT